MKARLSITVNKTTIVKLDESRGLIPRSPYIDGIISEFLNKRKKSPSQRQPGGRSS